MAGEALFFCLTSQIQRHHDFLLTEVHHDLVKKLISTIRVQICQLLQAGIFYSNPSRWPRTSGCDRIGYRHNQDQIVPSLTSDPVKLSNLNL